MARKKLRFFNDWRDFRLFDKCVIYKTHNCQRYWLTQTYLWKVSYYRHWDNIKTWTITGLEGFGNFVWNKFSNFQVLQCLRKCQEDLWEVFPDRIYLLKVSNRNSRKRCEICSKLTIKTPGQHHWHISHLFLVFLLLTLNR